MTSTSARPARRRRHPLASSLLLLLALALTGAAYAVVAPSGSAEAAGARTQSIGAGEQLFLANCSTCHGPEAQGTSDGPSLIGVGAAAVDFQVGTGRMPMAQPGAQAPENQVTFSQREIDDLAAFVASLGPGPAVPDASELDLSDADITEGGELFRTNCAMCHNFAGTGGALTSGKYAASLRGVSAKHMWEAMVTGPQAMPVFSDGTMTPEKKRNIIAYLHTLESDPPVAGLSLGSIGPVSEGLVVWVVGIGALIGCAVWLGWKSH